MMKVQDGLVHHRIFGLDLLRASAILFTVVDHSRHLVPYDYRKYVDLVSFDGVSIFFVLSGFLIGGILIKSFVVSPGGFGDIWGFWQRRWLRTIPPFLLIWFILMIFSIFFIDKFDWFSKLEYLLFLQNIWTDHPDFFAEAWSLSVEEWFYFSMPLLYLMLSGILRGRRHLSLILTICIFLIISVVFRWYQFIGYSSVNAAIWDLSIRKRVPARFDAMMFGVMAAYIRIRLPTYWRRYAGWFFMLGCSSMLLERYFTYTPPLAYGQAEVILGFFWLPASIMLMLPVLSMWKQAGGFIAHCIRQVSLISYPMYLLNLTFMQDWVIDFIDWSAIISDVMWMNILRYVIYWTLLFLFSTWMHRWVEVPVLRWRDRNEKTQKDYAGK